MAVPKYRSAVPPQMSNSPEMLDTDSLSMDEIAGHGNHDDAKSGSQRVRAAHIAAFGAESAGQRREGREARQPVGARSNAPVCKDSTDSVNAFHCDSLFQSRENAPYFSNRKAMLQTEPAHL